MISRGEQTDQAIVLGPWLKRARQVVDSRVKDASAHASAGLAAKANERLTELAVSLRALLETARGEFYMKAFTTQMLVLDPSILIKGVGPTREGEYAARVAAIAGVDQASTISAAVEKARRELMLAEATLHHREAMRPAVFAQWEIKHSKSINSVTSMALGTSQVALFHAVGQLMVRPEIR